MADDSAPGTTGPLESIGQIHISVGDLSRAVAFYRDVLGLRLLFEVPQQHMAFFDCGGVRLYLGRPSSPEYESHPLLYYRVRDLAAVCALLEGRGVTFTSPPHVVHKAETTTLWMAGFEDGEGNQVLLMEDVAKG
jgi:catechol 2,3-dioxygenase-like lactoylglutathione lyase family enzyme